MAYTFNVYDYLILTFVLLISISIGIYHGVKLQYPNLFKKIVQKIFKKKQIEPEITGNESQIKEYLIAGQSMSAIPIALSLLASFFSSTALLGMPAEVYEYGMEYLTLLLGIICTPFIGAFLTGPLFARIKVLSVFEYIKMRYRSKALHLIVVICYILRSLFNGALYIYGPSTTLDALTKIDTTTSIIIIGAVATFYTTIGGIKAVIWTDVIQVTIMIIGMMVIISKGVYDAGGLSELWAINESGGRLNFFNFDSSPFVRQAFWSLFFGGLIQFGLPYCVDQVMVQRFASAKNIKTAKIALLLNVPGCIIMMTICSFTGLVLYANFYKCDPISAVNIPDVKNPNQLLTYFVTDRLTVIKGIVGLFLSTILCSSLSSISSTLNSLSAIFWEDILKNMKYFNTFDDRKTTITAKVLVIICGAVCTALSLVVSRLGGNLVQINTTIIGSFNAPILGLFILSCVFPFANVFGGIAGTIIGFGVGLWLSFGSYFKKPLYPKLVVGTDCYNNNTIDLTTTYSAFIQHNRIETDSYNLRIDREVLNLSGFDKLYAISYQLFPFIATLCTVLIGIIVSFATCGHRETVDDKLILFPICNKFQKSKKIVNADLEMEEKKSNCSEE